MAGGNDTSGELYQSEPDLSQFTDITLEKNGGVLKLIQKEGTGTETPNTGDQVEVHYTGRLEDGKIFDSSVDRGERFKFNLGKGEVISGWDLAIRTMKRGEKCQVRLEPDFAYGKMGSPPAIPENAVLMFDIELFDWNMEDVTAKKDGGVRKTILVEGCGYSTPNSGSSVDVHLLGKLPDGKVVEDRELSFVLEEGFEFNIIRGVEIAIRKMKKDEKSRVFISKEYAWDDSIERNPNVPADMEQVIYDIHLKNFENAKEIWEMSIEERLTESEVSKNKGTEYFKASKFDQALKQYKKIVAFIGPPENQDFSSDKERRDKLLLSGYLNLSITCLKLSKPHDAISNAKFALDMDKNNEKGLFRRGQGYFEIREFDLAFKDFVRVLELDSNNGAARKQALACKKVLKEQSEKEKKLYRNMFDVFAKDDLKTKGE